MFDFGYFKPQVFTADVLDGRAGGIFSCENEAMRWLVSLTGSPEILWRV